MKNPIQPIYETEEGTLRFKENKIVHFLLNVARRLDVDMNELATMDFSQDDRQQFAQLIGYSVSGFGELSYVDDDTYHAVRTMKLSGLDEKDARISALQRELDIIREDLRDPIARLYGIHPDDLMEE